MNISIQFIPSAQMRYATWGDWFFDDKGDLIIQVANDEPQLPSFIHQFLIARHEMDEAMLCMNYGITQKQVDDFDFAFDGDGEPGDHPDAPYRKYHRIAIISEYQMAHEFGMDSYGKIE